jgi:DNA-directed RNA polymerase subunit F
MSELAERQNQVAHRLEMFERIDPEGAALIRDELRELHQRSMTQAATISNLQKRLVREAPRV